MVLNKKVVLAVLGGFALGKTGDMIFGGETARKVYTKCAALGMILKDNTMEKVEAIQAGASDIAADAREEADKYQAKRDAAFAAAFREEEYDPDDFLDELDMVTDEDISEEA